MDKELEGEQKSIYWPEFYFWLFWVLLPYFLVIRLFFVEFDPFLIIPIVFIGVFVVPPALIGLWRITQIVHRSRLEKVWTVFLVISLIGILTPCGLFIFSSFLR